MAQFKMWNINACVLLYCLRIVTMSLFIYSFHSLRGGINFHLLLHSPNSRFIMVSGFHMVHVSGCSKILRPGNTYIKDVSVN